MLTAETNYHGNFYREQSHMSSENSQMRRSHYSIVALLGCTLFLPASTDAQDQARPTQNRPVLDRHVKDQQSTTTVKEAIAKKLIMANKAEIELAQMAKQKSKNPQLSQFADKMITDHRQLNEKLQQFQASSDKSDKSAKPEKSESKFSVARPNTRISPAGQQTGNRQTSNQQSQMSDKIPQELCNIMDKAGANALTMTKEMLQNYDGEEFEMAFVGHQVVAHMMMLAELKAIESEELDQISQIAGQAATKTEQHLEELKAIAKDLKKNSAKG